MLIVWFIFQGNAEFSEAVNQNLSGDSVYQNVDTTFQHDDSVSAPNMRVMSPVESKPVAVEDSTPIVFTQPLVSGKSQAQKDREYTDSKNEYLFYSNLLEERCRVGKSWTYKHPVTDKPLFIAISAITKDRKGIDGAIVALTTSSGTIYLAMVRDNDNGENFSKLTAKHGKSWFSLNFSTNPPKLIIGGTQYI